MPYIVEINFPLSGFEPHQDGGKVVTYHSSRSAGAFARRFAHSHSDIKGDVARVVQVDRIPKAHGQRTFFVASAKVGGPIGVLQGNASGGRVVMTIVNGSLMGGRYQVRYNRG